MVPVQVTSETSGGLKKPTTGFYVLSATSLCVLSISTVSILFSLSLWLSFVFADRVLEHLYNRLPPAS